MSINFESVTLEYIRKHGAICATCNGSGSTLPFGFFSCSTCSGIGKILAQADKDAICDYHKVIHNKVIKVPFGAQYFVELNGNVVEYYKVSSTGVILTVRAPKTTCGEQYPYWSVSTYPDIITLTEAFGSGLEYITELCRIGTWSYLNE